MREEYLEQVSEYKDVFKQQLSDLEVNGIIRLSTSVIQNYAFGKQGILFSIEVL